MKILVLGIGNLLLQDEGAGVRAVEEFARRFEIPAGVELLDGGTSGIELLRYIQGKDCLILIDVVKSGNPPGTCIRLEGESVPAMFQKRISPHQLGLSDLLATAQLIDRMPTRVVLFGVEPKSLETGLEMSEEVGGAIGRLADMVAHELAALGLEVTSKSASQPLSHKTIVGEGENISSQRQRLSLTELSEAQSTSERLTFATGI